MYADKNCGECAESNHKCSKITQNKILKLTHNLPFYFNTDRLHALSNRTDTRNTLIANVY